LRSAVNEEPPRGRHLHQHVASCRHNLPLKASRLRLERGRPLLVGRISHRAHRLCRPGALIGFGRAVQPVGTELQQADPVMRKVRQGRGLSGRLGQQTIIGRFAHHDAGLATVPRCAKHACSGLCASAEAARRRQQSPAHAEHERGPRRAELRHVAQRQAVRTPAGDGRTWPRCAVLRPGVELRTWQ
jgi:hypothetical protein